MKYILVFGTILLLFFSACASAPRQGSHLTFGMVKKHIVKEQTHQEEILRLFGAPNIITKQAGKNETWTYEKVSYDASQYSGGIGAGAGGIIGTAATGGVGTFSGSKSSSSTKTMTVMIYFDSNDKVIDYSMMETHY
jgi:hypothetical protein